MNTALRPFIGRFCHVYLDDIVVWLNSLEEHLQHVHAILLALREHGLYVSDKKTELFRSRIDFLGHRISANGIEADECKVEKIISWLVPRNSTKVCSYLGLVQYLSSFLPKLTDFTRILTPLTTKEAEREFPAWNAEHQNAFESIKGW